MLRFREVLLVCAAALFCVLASAAQSSPTEKSHGGSDTNTKVIKVGVALLKNTAVRSVPATVERA